MTDERFDDSRVARQGDLAAHHFKGLVAAVGGGAGPGDGSSDAAARARVRMACARLGQPCGSGTGTPGDMLCCPDLTCGTDAVCCKDTNQTCVSNDDAAATTPVARTRPVWATAACRPARSARSVLRTGLRRRPDL